MSPAAPNDQKSASLPVAAERWRYEDRGAPRFWILDGQEIIATVHGLDEERPRRGPLLAAAPALRDTLRTVLRRWTHGTLACPACYKVERGHEDDCEIGAAIELLASLSTGERERTKEKS